MKRRLTQIMLVAALTVAGRFAIHAHETRLLADIPFGFQAQGMTLPAGTYQVKQSGANGVFILSNLDGSSIFVSAPIVEEGKTNNPHLTFRVSGDDKVLAELWGPEGKGYGVLPSTVEKELHRKIEMASIVTIQLHRG